MADPEGLAAFVESLPDGQRHRGFFWAAMTAVEDGLDGKQIGVLEQAALRSGLDEAYVRRTITEARERKGADDEP